MICPSALKKTIPVGWTCCNKPTGTQVVSDFLKGRVAEMCYADITGQAKDLSKKIKVIIDEVQGKTCVSSFYGFELSRDAVMEKLKKRQSLIEIYTDVKTQDGTVFRVFVMAVTSRQQNQLKVNSYAKSSQIKAMRKAVIQKLNEIVAEKDTKSFAYSVIMGDVGNELEKVSYKLIKGVKLQIYKMKTIRRGALDIKRLKDEAKNANEK